jgi:hypothetical protein
MSTAMFFERSEFREYVRLLAILHDLIASGRDEEPVGELLRDQMEALSGHFSDGEIASLNGISGDLYSLTEHAFAPHLMTEAVRDELLRARQAQRSGDYVAALELLRRNRSMLEPSQLSNMRARIFSEAGLNEVAIRFFRHASQLERPDDV